MTKNVLMILGIAGVLGAGTACFGLFTRSDDGTASTVEACAGLEGQARVDCERRQQQER